MAKRETAGTAILLLTAEWPEDEEDPVAHPEEPWIESGKPVKGEFDGRLRSDIRIAGTDWADALDKAGKAIRKYQFAVLDLERLEPMRRGGPVRHTEEAMAYDDQRTK